MHHTCQLCLQRKHIGMYYCNTCQYIQYMQVCLATFLVGIYFVQKMICASAYHIYTTKHTTIQAYTFTNTIPIQSNTTNTLNTLSNTGHFKLKYRPITWFTILALIHANTGMGAVKSTPPSPPAQPAPHVQMSGVLIGQAAEFKFESKFEPLQVTEVIWQSVRRLF